MPMGAREAALRCFWLLVFGGLCPSGWSPFSTATSGWQPSYTARPWALFTCMPFTSVVGDGGGETSRAVHRVTRFNSGTHNLHQDVTTIPSSPHCARMPEQMAGRECPTGKGALFRSRPVAPLASFFPLYSVRPQGPPLLFCGPRF